MQHYVMKFVSNRRGISPGNLVFSTNKFDRHDITEILLKVALSTINQTIKEKMVSVSHLDVTVESSILRQFAL